MLKKISKEALIFAVILVFASLAINKFRSLKIPSNLPTQLKLKLIDNSAYTPAKEKPIVINFWATWCGACKLELSTIQKLSKRDDIELVTFAVNSGSNEKIQEFMRRRGLDFRVVNDNNGIYAISFGISAFPTSIFYNSKEERKYSEVGYTTYAGFLARIKLLD